MTDLERVISHLQIILTWAKVDGESGRGIVTIVTMRQVKEEK